MLSEKEPIGCSVDYELPLDTAGDTAIDEAPTDDDWE